MKQGDEIRHTAPAPGGANAEGVRSPAVRWREYTVTVSGFPPVMVSARSRGAALYDTYMSYSACRECTFGEFMRIASARACPAPVKHHDGYDYIRRAYGVDVRVGERVALRDEGAASGCFGTVLYPGQSTAHVHVALDGRKRRSTVHPANIVQLADHGGAAVHGQAVDDGPGITPKTPPDQPQEASHER